jgi:ribokinase
MAVSIPTITIIGSLNMDLVMYTPRVPAGGETLTGSAFHTSFGGKGANQAVACAKLSRKRNKINSEVSKVAMVGAVGDDGYGREMKQSLEQLGVDVTGIITQTGMKTGIAMILVEEVTAQNRILLSPEANYSLQPEHFDWLKQQPPNLIIMQMEIPIQTILAILKIAHQIGIPTLLNAAPAQIIPDEYYPAVSHLILNETEASIMSGFPESSLETENGLQRTAQHFLKLGVKTVLITLGGRGVYYSTSSGSQSELVPAEIVEVVDTTAAGDTFIGAYALESVQPDFDIGLVVRKANKAAAKTVMQKGAQESIPWLDDL